ncbi:MAG: MarR family transcriptional regulator [Acetivibrio sp.]
MDTYDTINDILVHLFNEIWELEEKAIITEEFKDITNNDMHVIEAIGLGDGKNMSSIAKKLNITVGALTTAMNSLVKKEYAIRERSEKDRRVVYIRLAEKGEHAYNHHKEFHTKMIDAVIKSLNAEELPILMKTLKELAEFFRNYNEEK